MESKLLNCRPKDCVGGPSSRKQYRSDETNEAILAESVEQESDDAPALPPFNPLCVISEWQEPRTTTDFLTVAIILPTVAGSQGFKLPVSEDSEAVELTIDWMKPLLNIELLHKKWLSKGDSRQVYFANFSTHHQKVLGSEKYLRKSRSNHLDKISFTCRIGLPFSMKYKIIVQWNSAWRENTSRIVYFDLESIFKSYGLVNNSTNFETV